MLPGKNQKNAFVYKTSDRYKINWRVTDSVLANELLLREVLKTVPYIKGQLLDVGCGEKPYSNIFSVHIDSYVGIDLVQSLHGKHAVDIYASAHHLPFKKDTFDTVLCLEVLEHVERPLEVLKEIYAVLKKGGVLILSVPQNYWLHNDPRDFYRFTQQGLIELAKEQAGFTITYIHSLGGTREFLVDFVCKFILMKLNTGILGKIIPTALKKLIVTLPQILYIKLFRNTDVNNLFSIGNIVVATK
ncbi:MAG: class I SAM-dependent methyltransferase [Candidatus Brocadiales bacterium]|nr:class I SAM-dependent methyltransferase [Candidatus Brocadiales bacterium]